MAKAQTTSETPQGEVSQQDMMLCLHRRTDLLSKTSSFR